MAWRRHGRARARVQDPVAFAICDRCGFQFNRSHLNWQFDWDGPRLQNLRLLVCRTCMDKPFEHNRPIVVPPDPVPVLNPRPDAYRERNYNNSVITDQNMEVLTDTNGAPILSTTPQVLNNPPYPYSGFEVLRAESGAVGSYALVDNAYALQTSTPYLLLDSNGQPVFDTNGIQVWVPYEGSPNAETGSTRSGAQVADAGLKPTSLATPDTEPGFAYNARSALNGGSAQENAQYAFPTVFVIPD